LADPNSRKFGRPFKPQVWIVDEPSMLATDRTVELMEAATKRNARIVFAGDHQQLESVGIGRGFWHLQEAGLTTHVLNHWVRPKTDLVRETFARVMDNDYAGTISLLKSAGNVSETQNESLAISDMTSDWLGLSQSEQQLTQIIAPTNEQCQKITATLREGLKKQGEVETKDFHFTTYRDKHMTGEQSRLASAYERQDIVRFNQAHASIGGKRKGQIDLHEYFTVEGINSETNILALKSKKTHKLIYLDPSKIGGNVKGGIQVFNEETLSVSRGDKIRWLDNKNELGLKCNTELTVGRLSERWVRLDKADGCSVKVELSDVQHRHFTHDYAKTAYGVQGASKKNVLALMSSWRVNTTHARSFMVALTRATHNIKLYTDSVTDLVHALKGRSGSNTEALTQTEFKQAVAEQRIEQRIKKIPHQDRAIQRLN